MSDVLFVHRTQPSYLMAPVISVKADLVTQNKEYIYVPLASRTTFGSVKIGEGLNIEGGVLSFDKSEVSISTIAKNGEDIVPDENKRINITIDKTDVGLSKVDNTSDADKPVSALQQIEFDKKIDIYQGKEYVERALVVGEDGYVQPRPINITLDKDVVNKISVGGQNDAVNIGYTTINLKSLVEKSSSVGLPLATDTSAGLMSISDYKSIRELQTRVNRIENRVSKLLYDDTLYPTAEEIDAFVSSLGYTQPYDNIGVLVSGTHHIWHYYDNVGWIDDGIDIVDQFTNTTAGVIKGSSVIGKIYAETDGTGSVNGWDSLVLKLEGLENASDNYVKKQGYQEVTGPIVFIESAGIKNEDGTIDYIKHINNNLLITTSTGANLLNIDEGLSRVYFFNKEIAFKEDIGESSGTTVRVGGVAVAEFDADSKVDKTLRINGQPLTQNIVLTAADVGALDEIPPDYVTFNTLDAQLESLSSNITRNYYNKTDADGKFATKSSVEGKANTGTLENVNIESDLADGIYTINPQTCSGLPDIGEEEVWNWATLIVSKEGRILLTHNSAETTNYFYYATFTDAGGAVWTKIDVDVSSFVRKDMTSVIIGENATIVDEDADGVAIGRDTKNTLSYGVSVGVNVENKSYKGVAIGYNLQTSGNNSIVIGNNITNTDKANVAIGGSVNVSGERHVAIGLNTKVSGESNNVAINGNVTNAAWAIQLGAGTNTTSNTLQIFGDNIYNHETHTMTIQNQQISGTTVLEGTVSGDGIVNLVNTAKSTMTTLATIQGGATRSYYALWKWEFPTTTGTTIKIIGGVTPAREGNKTVYFRMNNATGVDVFETQAMYIAGTGIRSNNTSGGWQYGVIKEKSNGTICQVDTGSIWIAIGY